MDPLTNSDDLSLDDILPLSFDCPTELNGNLDYLNLPPHRHSLPWNSYTTYTTPRSSYDWGLGDHFRNSASPVSWAGASPLSQSSGLTTPCRGGSIFSRDPFSLSRFELPSYLDPGPSPEIAPQVPFHVSKNEFSCPEGCEKKTFGRRFELERHIREQHRCSHQDCKDVKLGTQKAKQAHEQEHNKNGPPKGWHCGSCLQKGRDAGRGLIRREKLKSHFKRCHGLPRDFDIESFRCKKQECSAGSWSGLYFISSSDLRTHERTEHPSSQLSLPYWPEHDPSAKGRSKSLGSCSIGSASRPAKRLSDELLLSQAKRPRLRLPNGSTNPINSSKNNDLVRHKSQEAQLTRSRSPDTSISRGASPFRSSSPNNEPSVYEHSFSPEHAKHICEQPEASSHCSHRRISHQALEKDSQKDTVRKLSMPASIPPSDIPSNFDQNDYRLPVTIPELHSLVRQQIFQRLVDRLDTKSIRCTFCPASRALELRGVPDCTLKVMKEELEGILHSLRRVVTQESRHNLNRVRHGRIHQQLVSTIQQPPIHAIHPEWDAIVLSMWTQKILPALPDIVRKARLGNTYSAALVRQEERSGVRPIIRFRSPSSQSEISRKLIRDKIKDICSQLSGCPFLSVQFSQGRMMRLTDMSMHSPTLDDPPNDRSIPHQRRPWPVPGMGASISMSQCHDTSATLGGYVSIDDEIYILSVDHFISACRCKKTGTNSLRSPSINDVSIVAERLRRRFEDIDLEVCGSAPEATLLKDVPTILFSSDLNEELEQLKRFGRDLDVSTEFEFGRIRHRSGNGQPVLRGSRHPCSLQSRKRMDWSLSEVTKRERQGKNKHRHGRENSLTTEDCNNEVLNPDGSGPFCHALGEIKGGETVHYVGTASGFREGVINAAPILYSDKHGISHEWSIVVPNCEKLPDSDFYGDSGAWILNDDNELLGLLWGWDNGNLLFTPIQDVFADIVRTTGCRKMKLPSLSPASTPEPPDDAFITEELTLPPTHSPSEIILFRTDVDYSVPAHRNSGSSNQTADKPGFASICSPPLSPTSAPLLIA